jgi:hypothetical protein
MFKLQVKKMLHLFEKFTVHIGQVTQV